MESLLLKAIEINVRTALEEDIGGGDITASLIEPSTIAEATIITRETAVLCGTAWVNEVFKQLDSRIKLTWHAKEGDTITASQTLCTLQGLAQHLLTGERTALNFLQTLSGTATVCRHYAKVVADTNVKLLDSRKTIPGLRLAQKYAVTMGGCFNHRLGLYDAFLIKENHINACGSITAAVTRARQLAPSKPVEVEVETLEELKEALSAGCDVIMLDNFDIPSIHQAVKLTDHRSKLEISGGVNQDNLRALAQTGVDYISIGALTKHLQAIDLSMRFKSPPKPH
jgi:nicotinate-nucleotide pyrophosphorylase (carboxylating)